MKKNKQLTPFLTKKEKFIIWLLTLFCFALCFAGKAKGQTMLGLSVGFNQSVAGKLDISQQVNKVTIGGSLLANISSSCPVEFQLRGGYIAGNFNFYGGIGYLKMDDRSTAKTNPAQNKTIPVMGIIYSTDLPRNGKLYFDAGYSNSIYLTVGIGGIF